MKRLSVWISFVIMMFAMMAVGASGDSSVYRFRLPREMSFRVPQPSPGTVALQRRPQWIRAAAENGSSNAVYFGSRVVVRLAGNSPQWLILTNSALTISRIIAPDTYILQAPDAASAMAEARRLAGTAGVVAAYPVLRRDPGLHGPYAQRTDDPFFVPYFNPPAKFEAMWPWEDRDYDGTRLGIDLNVLAAWPYSMGQGVTVAVCDSGLELQHAELSNRVFTALNFNFDTLTTNGMPTGGGYPGLNIPLWSHGTAVAGLIAAEANNRKGMAGIAPKARLASWVIFDASGTLVSDEHLMDMYQYGSGRVDIENHSWGAGNGTFEQAGPTLLEDLGIDAASSLGRNGLGTVLIRSAGNDRELFCRADDDGYPADPRVIAVGAVNRTGRVTSYSEPGACLLLATPGGGGDSGQGLFALDLIGPNRGVNSGITYQDDLNDYRWGFQGFIGTSASAPLVSGIAALVLSANSNLTYRDVQQILLLSAHQGDPADPDLRTNGSGFLVSHNVGFGIPDAGEAVRLARLWSNRPPLVTLEFESNVITSIPDDALRVEVSGAGVPANVASIHCLPGIGPHADDPTPSLPIVDVGGANDVPPLDLTNKAALILRGNATFETKIGNVARAGAAFAIIRNYSTNVDAAQGGERLTIMGGTGFTPIPAVFVGERDGLALLSLIGTNNDARARLAVAGAETTFSVKNPLLCEQVGVRVRTDHARRGDLRITLISPAGTRSVLQTLNNDASPGPADWTYWSTHNFFETSVGDWKVVVADESSGATGSVQSVSLLLRGTAIKDTDHDGLDDDWESIRLGSLDAGPAEDSDGDGFSNMREQLMGTNPQSDNASFALELSWWELAGYRLPRLTWPGRAGVVYEVIQGTNVDSLMPVAEVPGTFPETEWLGPAEDEANHRFFRLRRED